jgi:hypothetical protein
MIALRINGVRRNADGPADVLLLGVRSDRCCRPLVRIRTAIKRPAADV